MGVMDKVNNWRKALAAIANIYSWLAYHGRQRALIGGDDAYFVAGSKWLGVASGVCQWSFEGTSSGVYAQELMKTCEEIVLDTCSVPVTNPFKLLCVKKGSFWSSEHCH
ncbi:probable protein phosphatase 2C 71 [Helianthus annuus]|uniref:probable protein phosphatase 2C 71 n=1 Tax=Helianthus annuus TaxID=4232 RepID=UPI000B90930E|nr:probable protein phosphatase 2C 71 [Helianthus annuus]XP_035833677.1 probable protein phosphatase 2C 71 [Helianthus annuus]